MSTSQHAVLYTFAYQSDDRDRVRENHDALDRFLAEVERHAFRMAEIATRNADDAMDIVQDAMIRLVEKYADKPVDEWRPLFFTILNSRITDYHRRATLTGRIFRWIGSDDDENWQEPGENIAGPLEALTEQLTAEILISTLQALPYRQQQAFMLRTWQGFSVAETASIMKCSEGSVKTHLSRANEALTRAIKQDIDHE